MAKKAESKRATDSNGATNGKHAADRMPDASPIYFRSLQVRNVRCFGDEPQTIHFNTPDGSNWAKWTIILGNNGTGKSTLLQILDRLSVDSDPFCQPSDEESEWLVFDDTKLTEKPNFKRDESSTARLPSSYESRAEIEYGVQKQEGASLSYSVGSLVKVSFGAGFRRSETFEHFEKGEVYLQLFGYGAWRRLGSSTIVPEHSSHRKWFSHLFDDSIELINAEEWLQRLDYSVSKASAIREELNRKLKLVKETLLSILPDSDIERIHITPPSKEFPNPRVLFKTPFGEVGLRQLGFGFQSLISWVVDFAARMFDAYPDSANPLAEPAVCLVDEIDLHLHPTWQRKVMKYLSERFPKTQFIATAHSPLIVQAAPEIGANVAVLRREGDHVVISNNPIDVQGWRADQILSSELFDNQPLRSPEIQTAIDERTRLLAKQKLTTKDQKRLVELDAIVDELPVGSTPDERNIAAQLKAAASLLDRVTSRKS